jgi:very-short-patch-repair endonuclease
VKACGEGAVLSHFAAASLWGLVEWDHRPVDVTVTTEGTRLHRGIKTHRTSVLEPCDLTCRQGIPVTSPARTVLDCAAVRQGTPLRRLVREAQACNLVTVGEIAEVLGRLAPRRGSRRLANIVATGAAPTRSELEDAVLDLLLRGGFAHPEVNQPLVLDGRRVVPDFRWAAERLVVEADGAAWHDHRLAREDDAERQALLEAHGNRVLRVTWDQAIARGPQTLARIKAAGAPLA